MHKISVHDAEKKLRLHLDEADQGQDVVISRGDGASFKLVPLTKQDVRRTSGSACGDVWMSDNFDLPLDGLERLHAVVKRLLDTHSFPWFISHPNNSPAPTHLIQLGVYDSVMPTRYD
jgi:antitoxin (DNA-binding transcriptional repressor) of toxin-antitoxin stability system